ncbi:hypothetical protein BH10BAC3_BH10BAC3_09670 [soil metagenome]
MAKNNPAEGVSMEQQPFEAHAVAHQYEFIAAGKNIYLIKLKGTDLYLTPSGDGATNSDIILKKIAINYISGVFMSNTQPCS